MVPFIAFVAPDHVRLVSCPTYAVQLDFTLRYACFNKISSTLNDCGVIVVNLICGCMLIHSDDVVIQGENNLRTAVMLRGCQGRGLWFGFLVRCYCRLRSWSVLGFLGFLDWWSAILTSRALSGGASYFFLRILLITRVAHNFLIVDVVFILEVSCTWVIAYGVTYAWSSWCGRSLLRSPNRTRRHFRPCDL